MLPKIVIWYATPFGFVYSDNLSTYQLVAKVDEATIFRNLGDAQHAAVRLRLEIARVTYLRIIE